MSKSEKNLFGSQEISKHLNNFLLAQATILKGVVNQRLSRRANEVKIVLASACNTATAIAKLGAENEFFYNEAVMLSRSFIEKIINFCYLMVCSNEDFEKFMLHALYKSYQNLDKNRHTEKMKIGVKFKGKDKINIEKNPKLKKALILFPKKKMNWTKLDINQRVKYIDQKTDMNTGIFLLNTLSIYSDASEALHGSLYGCSFHTFAYDPTIDHEDKEEVNENLQKNVTLLYWQLGAMIHEVIKLLNTENDLQKLFQGSLENNQNTLKIMKKITDNENLRT